MADFFANRFLKTNAAPVMAVVNTSPRHWRLSSLAPDLDDGPDELLIRREQAAAFLAPATIRLDSAETKDGPGLPRRTDSPRGLPGWLQQNW
jgi:hypothetical protein